MADIILPGAAYTEKVGTYVNTEVCVGAFDLAVYAQISCVLNKLTATDIRCPMP